jgi:hypothetical protein
LEGTDKAKGKKIKNDGDHHIGAANNGGDENHWIGGEGEAKDEWTKEEEKQLQYGFQRTLLKKHGVTKTHIKNLAKVLNEYPGLGGTMDFISTKGRGNVQEIAEAIRAVPMFGSQRLPKTNKNGTSKVLCGPKHIPEMCGYIQVERDCCALLNKTIRNRSRKMYEQRKKEEIKPMKILNCFVHEKKTVLEMSK